MIASPVNLEALYAGGDPWNWTPGTRVESTNESSDDLEDALDWMNDPGAKEAPPGLSELGVLEMELESDGIPTDRLDEWLKLRAQTKNESVENVVKACIGRDILPKFKQAFANWIKPEPKALAV